MRTLPALIVAALMLSLFACAEESYDAYVSESAEEAAYNTAADSAEYEGEGDSYVTKIAAGPYARADKAGEADTQSNQTRAVDQRKIIYNADVDLVVDDFKGVPGKVQTLVKKHGGFVAGSSVRGSEGEPRTGTWTLRIPSANYDAFVAGSETLGQVRSVTTGTREVTAEYVDLESRINNLKAEETRLNKHLQESTGKLDDILKVEREISRVRGEIERHQGRLNVLKDLTSLSTVTLTIQEIKNYVPEPTEEPGYGTKVARTWGGSLGALGDFLTNLSLGVVALAPWLVILVPLGVVGWIVSRKAIRKARQALTPKPQAAG
ncbi:MAG: DUF4349 domain-containing protein [Phycisphaeraceae bacterium]